MIETAVCAAVRQALREPTANVWTDTQLGVILDQVLREIRNREPLLKRANLAVVDYTRDVDISGLTTLANIIRVEYPVSYSTYLPVYRNYTQYGDAVTLDLTSAPTIVSGTLTGTVTFTVDSRTVSGVGTAFTTELSTGYLIGKSGGTKFYQVAKLVSATSLVLEEPFEEDTGADTINLTKYRNANSCVRIHYGAGYTVNATSDLPLKHDETMVLGVVAHAAIEYAANYVQLKLEGVTSLLANAGISAGNASARIHQAVTDIASGRTNLAIDLTGYHTTLTDVETALDQIAIDLASGRDLVNTANLAGPEAASKYTEMARTDAQEAQQRIEKARSYLEAAKTNHDYYDIAAQELAGGATYINQAQSHIAQAEQSINVSGMVRRYQNWADMKYQEYQIALNRLGRFSDGIVYLGLRAI